MNKLNIKDFSKARRAVLKEIHRTNKALVVIRVGDDPASEIYVRNKRKACGEANIIFWECLRNENYPPEDLIQDIKEYNKNPDVGGILVQLPLPKTYTKEDELKIISSITPEKDVDGFTEKQVYKLYTNDTVDRMEPCTAKGIVHILDSVTSLEGKNVVVVGRSNIVGKPVAHLLLEKNATVTICHSKTKNLEWYTNNADIIILAIGKAKYFNHKYFNQNTNEKIVVDVGINRLNGKVIGDLDVEDIEKNIEDSSYISYTPVPGGVGLMTVTELLENVIKG